jgi:hypothetical protein
MHLIKKCKVQSICFVNLIIFYNYLKSLVLRHVFATPLQNTNAAECQMDYALLMQLSFASESNVVCVVSI